MFDLLIRNGAIINGTGSPSFYGDIGITDGKIVKIGKGLSQAKKIIETDGLVVTPGFIDSHSHSDSRVLEFPEQIEKIEQGITTSIAGQCGNSPAPIGCDVDPETAPQVSSFGKTTDVYADAGTFLNTLKEVSLGANMAAFVGHGALRRAVMGIENRAPTAEELERMKQHLRIAMDHGALGVSFGLIYTPGCYAKTDELIEIAKVVGQRHGIIAAHIRDEGHTLTQAVAEFLAVIRASGARGVLSHHKAIWNVNWGKVHTTLRMLDQANAEGLDVYCDVYPYTASSTSLSATFVPADKRALGTVKVLRDPELRAACYTFTLRDRHFSNGKKITMEDVEASIRRAIALGVTTEATYNKNFKGATWTFTEDKLVVTFEELNIFFSTVMCSYGSVYKIMPKEICEKYPFTGGTETAEGFVWGAEAPMINEVEDVIGSGPYTLTKWNGESEIVLTRNENYDIITEGNEDAIGLAAPQKAYCDTITFAINADAASRTAAMMAKEYHVALIQDSMVEAANAMGIIGENDGSTWTYSIFFNLHESNADSPVADVNVRKAIRAAIDCNAAMLAVTGGNQDRVHMDPYPMVKSNTVYANTIFEDCGEWNIHDVELAKKYLAQSNYNGEPIVYLTPSSGNIYNVAMAIIPQLEAIGLNIELKIVDSGSHTAMRKDPATGHDIGGWIVGQNETAPTHTSYVTGTAAGWWTNDVKTEALKELETNPIGSEKSVAAYKAILQAVADEVPYIVMGRADTYLYRWPEVVTDFNGSTIYYWNSYFVK